MLLHENQENLIVDVMLGLSFAKANVLWSIDKIKKVNKQETNSLITKLEDLVKRMDVITEEYYKTNRISKLIRILL